MQEKINVRTRCPYCEKTIIAQVEVSANVADIRKGDEKIES